MLVGQLPLVACGASRGVSVLGWDWAWERPCDPHMMQHSQPGSPKLPPTHIWSLGRAPHPSLETLKRLHTMGVLKLLCSSPFLTSPLSLLVTHRPSVMPGRSGTRTISRQHPLSPGVGKEPEQKSKGAGEGGEAATRATLGVWPYCEGSRRHGPGELGRAARRHGL